MQGPSLAEAVRRGGPVIKPGFQKATVHGARLFVLPNPSGRNAHFSYDDMLRAFRALGRAMRRCRAPVRARRPAARLLHQQHQRQQQQEHHRRAAGTIDTNATIAACCWTVANSDA